MFPSDSGGTMWGIAQALTKYRKNTSWWIHGLPLHQPAPPAALLDLVIPSQPQPVKVASIIIIITIIRIFFLFQAFRHITDEQLLHARHIQHEMLIPA